MTKHAEQCVTKASKWKAKMGKNAPKTPKCKSNVAMLHQRKVNNRDERNLIGIEVDFDK